MEPTLRARVRAGDPDAFGDGERITSAKNPKEDKRFAALTGTIVNKLGQVP